MRVELRAALRAAGIDPDQPYEWQHSPPLAMRPWNEATQDYEPAENDDKHLIPMQAAEHRKVTSEVDIPAIAKTRRLAKAQRVHAEALKRFGITAGVSSEKPKKRRWPSRPFQKRKVT